MWLLYVVFAIAFTYPGIFHFSSHVFGDGGDNIEYISYATLVKERLNEGLWPFGKTDTFWYPYGFDLAIGSEAKLFTAVTALLSYVLPLTVAYNLMVIVVLVVNAGVTFLFFKKIGSSVAASFIGGAMYGMSYYVLAKAGGHINLMMVFPIPLLCLYLADVYMKRMITSRAILGCGLAALLFLLSSVQYLAIVLATTMLLSPLFLMSLPRIRKISLQWKKPVFILSAVAIGWLMVRLSVPYLMLLDSYVFREDIFKLPRAVDSLFLLTPNTYLVSIVGVWFQKFWQLPEGSIELSLYLGTIESGLVIGWVFSNWKKTHSLTLFMIGVIFLFVSLGIPIGSSGRSLYTMLQPLFPFTIIWESERFFIVYYLVFAYCVVQFLDYLKPRRLVIAVILFMLVAERFTGNYYLTPLARLNGYPYAKVVAKTRTTAVMDVPFLYKHYDTAPPTLYNLLPVYYQKPIVGGYYHWLAENDRGLRRMSGVAQVLTCDNKKTIVYDNAVAIYDSLIQHGVQTIVVHKNVFFDDRCLQGEKRWQELLTHMESLRVVTRIFTNDETDVFYIDKIKPEQGISTN